MAVENPVTQEQESLGSAPTALNFEQYFVNLRSFLAVSPSESVLRIVFLSRLAYFLVKGDFGHFTNRIETILKALVGLPLPIKPAPTRAELTALLKGDALTLFSILRLSLTFEYVRKNHPQLWKDLLLSPKREPRTAENKRLAPHRELIARESVVPSIRHASSKNINYLWQQSGITEERVVTRMNDFLRCYEPDSEKFNPVPSGFLSNILIKGIALKTNRAGGIKEFRVTTTCAMAICFAVSKRDEPSDQSHLPELLKEVNSNFREEPASGPGKGKFTTVLKAAEGNQVFLIEMPR